MDMAPRWEGGCGGQVRHEFRQSDDLIHHDDDASNSFEREKSVHTRWIANSGCSP
jgi:hypothetical protein